MLFVPLGLVLMTLKISLALIHLACHPSEPTKPINVESPTTTAYKKSSNDIKNNGYEDWKWK